MKVQTEYFVYPLRYYPSIVTGEFLNVGVALVCPAARWWDLRVAVSLRGFRRVFSTAQPSTLRAALRRIEDIAAHYRETRGSFLDYMPETWQAPLDPVVTAVGQLWGSLRWGDEPICGITLDPTEDLEYWFAKLVHIAQPTGEGAASSQRDGVLSDLLEDEFSSRGLLDRMRPAEVGTYVKEVFDLTYRNGRLNVFETVRLNYLNPGRIRAHAQQWRGRIDTLNDGLREKFNFFALVDLPQSGPQREEAELGLQMIRNANANRVETFTPDEVERLGEVAESVVEHAE